MKISEAPKNREEWLSLRKKGIGASEASAVVGQNPYMSNIDLWEYKTGRREPEDISDKPCVRYGTNAEKYLRGLYALDYEDVYEVGYDEFDMYYSEEYPFIFATLDGRLTERETGRKGILEVKTTEILRSIQNEKWEDNSIPQNYYLQTLHQLLATGWDFVNLTAQLTYNYDGSVRKSTKNYHIEREEVKSDLDYLLSEEISFWECVKKDVMPPRKLYLP